MKPIRLTTLNPVKATFESVALKHLNTVFRAAYALSGKVADAEDLTQTTYLKALEKFDTYEAGTNCRAWLLAILRHTWIDRLRHREYQKKNIAADQGWQIAAPESDDLIWTNAYDLLENFSDETVIRALNRLPGDLRLTLFLSDVEGCSQEEIAGIVDVAVGTVKSRVSRARTLLRNELSGYAKEMGYKKEVKK